MISCSREDGSSIRPARWTASTILPCRTARSRALRPNIPAPEAARVIEVGGKLVTPGLIDLHAHVFEGVNRKGVNPDLGGVYAGVTTIVDAGSAGAATFAAFPTHILPACHTEVIPFLHICQTGLATMPDIIAESSINLDDTLKTCAQYKGLIHGIKARMVSPALEIMGMEMPKLAKRAAKESGIRAHGAHRGHGEAI